MDFDDPKLVAKFGSWVRVQVAFYDFIFETGTKLCPTHWNELAINGLQQGQFADGADLYEDAVAAIGQAFGSSEDAWRAFLRHHAS